MKRLLTTFLWFGLVFVLESYTFAGTSYVITTDNNVTANSASVYSLNTSTGTLKLVKRLKTGGTALGGGFFASVTQAITRSAGCVFIADTASDDIAAFAAPSYNLVGRFSNSALSFSAYGLGGSIALTPKGNFLYGAYSGSLNIGAWQVNGDCSLTFIAAYVPSAGADYYATLGVSPNGLSLIVPVTDYGAAEAFAINTNGTLSDIGFLGWGGSACAPLSFCAPDALDFTKDSKIVVFGNASDGVPGALTASLTSQGLTNPQAWPLENSDKVVGSDIPFFSAAGYAGSGNLYFGICGPMLPGVTTTNFNENPLSISVLNTTVVDSEADGAIAVTGDTMVIAESPNVIGVYRINADGSISLLSKTTDSKANALVSLSIYPNDR